MKKLIAVAATLAAFSGAGAQVGYEPAKSPYRDLERSHEATYYSGYYSAKLDPARVAPQSGPLIGLRYQWRAGGPVNLIFDASRVESERRVLDPERKATCPTGPVADCKLIGVYRWPLYFADFGLGMNLTGARSYHRFVPEGRASLGFVTDFHTNTDVGDFQFGTKMTMSLGAALRWVPGGRYQIRADIADRIYTVKYPTAYYEAAPDSSAILLSPSSRFSSLGIPVCCGVTSKHARWMNNAALTVGISYLFGR